MLISDWSSDVCSSDLSHRYDADQQAADPEDAPPLPDVAVEPDATQKMGAVGHRKSCFGLWNGEGRAGRAVAVSICPMRWHRQPGAMHFCRFAPQFARRFAAWARIQPPRGGGRRLNRRGTAAEPPWRRRW